MSKEKKNQTVEKASPLETQNIVHALAYFPYFIGAIGMFFLAKTEKKALLHHVKYSAFLALGACIGLILFRGGFAMALNIAYIGFCIYLALKAYKGEEVKVEILDSIEEKIIETVKK